jgi:hypothetical protein
MGATGGEGEGIKEIKVRAYGRWTSYMKKNKETSCNCFKWGRVGI